MANQDHLRAEQLSVSKVLGLFEKGMMDRELNWTLNSLHQWYQPAMQYWERTTKRKKVCEESIAVAQMKLVDGIMFDVTAIYSPQAQARIYQKMIDVLNDRRQAIRRNINNETLLSRHILTLCMSADFQDYLSSDLKGIRKIGSFSDAMREVCDYCQAVSLMDFDGYGVKVHQWYAIETMFLAWLDRKNETVTQELKQA